MQMDGNGQLVLPKNIRQMGTFGETYKVYVEDFVYTYVHQFLHQRKKEDAVLAAVLLGKTVSQDGQEYIFINGAQKAEFQFLDEDSQIGGGQVRPDKPMPEKNANPNTESAITDAGFYGDLTADAETETQSVRESAGKNTLMRQQEFWNRVYQRIKESFDDCEILGWYFNLDGSGLEISAQLQQFFEATYRKGSRFLYYEDSVEKEDAFFVQEQHRLQRLSGYAVYYEKNPQMQEFMIAERERTTPRPLRESYRRAERDEVVENYRAIMNKLNEKPARKKLQPVVYVAGAAVLAVVVAMGVSQIGNYQSLKVLEQTMQTLSRAVGGLKEDVSATEEASDDIAGADASADSAAEDSANKETAATPSADVAEDVSKEDLTDDTAGTTASDPAGSSSASDAVSSESAKTETSADYVQTDDGAQTTEASNEDQNADVDAAEETSASPSDYYIVREGDNLASICREIYGTTDRIQEICDLNAIENMDVIYEGQKLLLP